LHGDRYCDAEDPPYKFIHMLKGISIYPESLSSSKRIVRGIRRAERSERDGECSCPAGGATGRGMVLVDAENNILDIPGQLQMSHLVPPSGTAPAHSQARLERALPVRADYCCLDSSSASSSQTSSKTASPFTPASSEPEPEPNLGSLSLTVDYNFPKKALVVTIVGARGLPAIDEQAGSSDPYVKMTILPEKKHRVKTRVLRKTLDPIFDETFTFYGVAYSSLPELTLHFLVLSFDRFARDDVIGEAVVPLKGVDPSTGRVHLSQQITKRNMQVRMAALQAFQGFSTLYNTVGSVSIRNHFKMISDDPNFCGSFTANWFFSEHVTHTEIRWKQQLVEFSWRLGIILSGSDGLTLLGTTATNIFSKHTSCFCEGSLHRLLCESRGELLASLSYQPVSHRLSVVVLKARHLPKMDMTGLSA
ncbi:hypothetical protein XENOCAPTIV_002685, partial [Xenoophorus captivus]